MAAQFDTELLSQVSSLVAARMGLHFPQERWPDLARGLKTACSELGFKDGAACRRWLETGDLTQRQLETLASHLTVGETYFFRDPASFEVFEKQILPEIAASKAATTRSLRMWSAGCATGEEPYSLAIACSRALPNPASWRLSILGTDINTKFLAKAEAGVYTEWSFRGTEGSVRQKYFSPGPEKKFRINPPATSLVRFGYLNLAEDVYPALHNETNAMDVVFCRNVLMYFTPVHQRRVVAALHRCLVDGGYLFVNPAEVNIELFSVFSARTFGDVTCYCKSATASADELPWKPDHSVAALPLPELEPSASVEYVAAASVAPATPPALPDEQAQPTLREDALALARRHADEGRLDEALASCRLAIDAERTNPAAHFLYATICHELDQYDEAIAALGKVLYLDQDFILAHHALGRVYRRLNRHKASRRHYATALKLLSARERDEIVPGSDGMTCGRLMESVRAMTED